MYLKDKWVTFLESDLKKQRRKVLILFIGFLILVLSIFVSGKVYTRYSREISLPIRSVLFDTEKTLYCHFSVDDSISIFEDLTNNEYNYKSIFEQPILGFMKKMHDQYGIKVSFYVFYSWDTTKEIFCLSDATSKFINEFEKNSDWLRFGFHAKDALAYEELTADIANDYYIKTEKELKRIVGEKCIDYFLRLDRYVANKDIVKELSIHGVKGLLTAPEISRDSYSLSEDEKQLCYENDWYIDNYSMSYTPTDIQIENLKNVDEFYESLKTFSSQPRIEIFTHEWALNDLNVKNFFEWYAYSIQKNKVTYSFSKP